MAEEQKDTSKPEGKTVQAQHITIPCGGNEAFKLKITIELETVPAAESRRESQTLGTDPGSQGAKTGPGTLGTDPGDLSQKTLTGTLGTKIHF